MDPTTTTPDLFISHSTKDDPEVDCIAEALRAAGLSVWVDHQNGILIGTPSFDQMIQDNLNKCRRGLLILTGDSARSLECNGEWRHLLTHKRLYVARLKDFPQQEFPSRLAIIQYANLLRDYGQGLEALIQALQQDTALAAAHPGTALALRTSGQFLNWQLSRPIIGRDAALEAVGRQLTEARALILTGPGGVGKTRLAVELAARAANPDGVVWHTLAPAATPAEAKADLDRLTVMLREHLGRAATDTPDAVWQALGASQTLLILDNAEDCQHPQPFVARLNGLDQRRDSLGVLITSRHVWPQLKAAKPYALPMPAAPDAARILHDMIDATLDNDRARPSAAEVAALAEAGRYHPRLLEFAAAWLQDYPARQVEKWLRTLEGEKPEEVLANVVGHTLDLLARQPKGPLALAALRRLLVCRGGFTYEAAEALLADLPGAIDTLDVLRSWNLLRYDGSRYDTDLLTRETEDPDLAAHALHYDYYRTLTYRDTQYGIALSIESPNVEAAFEWSMQTGDYEKAYWFANRASEQVVSFGFERIVNWLGRIKKELALSPNAVNDFKIKVDLILGKIYSDRWASIFIKGDSGRRPILMQGVKAYLDALSIIDSVKDPIIYGSTQISLGEAYHDLAVIAKTKEFFILSIESYEQALIYLTPDTDAFGYARAKRCLGMLYKSFAELDAEEREQKLYLSIDAYQQAILFLEPTADLNHCCLTHLFLGNVYKDISRFVEKENNLYQAIKCYKNSLGFFASAQQGKLLIERSLGFAYYAESQQEMGIIYSELNELSVAISCWQIAKSYYCPPTNSFGWHPQDLDKAAKVSGWIQEAEKKLRNPPSAPVAE